MKTFRFLKFYGPDAGGEGGGAAVLDAPPAPEKVEETGPTPGDRYREAMKKTGGDEDAQPAPKPAKAKESEPASEKPPAPAKEEKGKQAKGKGKVSALDSVLEPEDNKAPAKEEKGEIEIDAETATALKDLPAEMTGKDGKVNEHWAKARGALEREGRRITELSRALAEKEKAIASASGTPPEVQARIADLEKQLDEYKDALVGVNVQYDPQHRAKYIDGRAKQVDKAASKLEAYGGDPVGLKKALSLPDGRARTEAITDSIGDSVHALDAAKIMAIVADIDKLDEERAEIEADPQGAWQKLQQAEQAKQAKKAEELEGMKKSVFEKVFQHLPKTLLLLRKVAEDTDGGPEWNSRVDTIRNGAWELASPNTPPEAYAEAAVWSKAGPIVQDLLVETRTELKAALKRLAEYEDAEPGIHNRKKPDEKEYKTPGQRYHEARERLAGREE